MKGGKDPAPRGRTTYNSRKKLKNVLHRQRLSDFMPKQQEIRDKTYCRIKEKDWLFIEIPLPVNFSFLRYAFPGLRQKQSLITPFS